MTFIIQANKERVLPLRACVVDASPSGANTALVPPPAFMTSRFVALVAVLLLASCSTAAVQERVLQDAVGDQADVDVDADGTMHVETSEGSFTAGNTELPADWPSDAPAVYPGASITYSATVNPSTGNPGSAVMMTTDDAGNAVASFYKSALADKGWQVSATMEGGGNTIITATKDDRTFSMILAAAGDQTSITLAIEKKAE